MGKKSRFEIDTGIPRMTPVGTLPFYPKTVVVNAPSSNDILRNQERYAGSGREVFGIRKVRK